MARKSAKSPPPADATEGAGDAGKEAGNESFEDLRLQIDALISRIENEEVPLEEAVASFERATLLTRRANRILADAEQRVTMLMEGEEFSAEPDADEG
jgi:exodeoxyribonuclease VII small subunit